LEVSSSSLVMALPGISVKSSNWSTRKKSSSCNGKDGLALGDEVGDDEGFALGILVGTFVGDTLGLLLGFDVGREDG